MTSRTFFTNSVLIDGKLTHSIVLRHRLSAKVGHESPRKAGREGVPGRGGGGRERERGGGGYPRELLT